MAERYKRVFSLPANIYYAGSPVIIQAGALLKDELKNAIVGQLKFKSVSDKTITAIKVHIIPKDVIGNLISGEIDFEYLDLNLKRDQTDGEKTPISLSNIATREILVSVDQVIFSDKSTWTRSGEKPVSLTELESLKRFDSVHDADLSEQYRIRFGEKALYIPQLLADLWVCSCGAINRQEESDCHSCGCSKELLFSISMESLKKEATDRINRINEEKELEKKRRKEQQKRRNKIIAIAAILLLVCVAGYFSWTKIIQPEMKYKQAVSLYDSGKYEEAIDAFTELGGYRDSTTQIENCNNAILEEKYKEAKALCEKQEHEKAVKLFQELGNYKDSKQLMSEQKHIINNEKIKEATVIGANITFGTYKYDTDSTEKDIEWIVIKREENRVLVISKYGLDCQPYNQTKQAVTWETCSLRKWLNGTFFNEAFDKTEQEMIPTVKVAAEAHPDFDASPGNSTNDRVFLLNYQEFMSLEISGSCSPTNYVRKEYLVTDGKWWLRSPGFVQEYASYVNDAGVSGFFCSTEVDTRGILVRPVIWIEFDN